MSARTVFLLCAAVAAVSVAITRYYWPRIERQTVVQEKVVVRTDVRTVTRTVKEPSGRTETVTEVIDNTVRTEDKKSTKTVFKRSDWLVSVGAPNLLEDRTLFQLQVNRRVLGPVFLGVSGNTDAQFGAFVGMEF